MSFFKGTMYIIAFFILGGVGGYLISESFGKSFGKKEIGDNQTIAVYYPDHDLLIYLSDDISIFNNQSDPKKVLFLRDREDVFELDGSNGLAWNFSQFMKIANPGDSIIFDNTRIGMHLKKENQNDPNKSSD